MKAVVIVALLAAVAQCAAFPPMWPLPKQFTSGDKTVTVNPKMEMKAVCKTSDDLTRGFSRFLERTFIHTVNASSTGVNTVTVCLKDPDAPLGEGMDESYTLKVDSNITLECNAVFGCYHGLETLSQLIGYDYDVQMFNILSAPWSITDAPRFPHRGLLIDTSRHYEPVRIINSIIDSMTYNKLNVLHWHLVDSHAFPYDSPTYPTLGQKGAYSPKERYTTDDLKSVTEYARQRGVRIMVELDSPGHTAAMCDGLPGICPDPLCKYDRGYWAIDFTKNKTFEVFGNLFKELGAIFPDKLMHIGGDEVDTRCWSEHKYIVDWCKERNMTINDGYLYSINKVTDLVQDLKRSVVGWQEIWNNFGTKLKKDTIIHQWLPNSVSLPKDVTSKGYRLLWSDSSVWYLDHLNVVWDWMYNAEPCKDLTDDECSRVLGGEGCMWGETADPSDVQQTIWPRMSAIAERLWSPRESKINDNTLDRLSAIRCLYNERGIAAAPVQNKNARQAPPNPGSCFRQ